MADTVEADSKAASIAGRPRRPWVAAVLNFLVPGLGDLYAGFHRRAALLFLLFPVADIAIWLLFLLVPIPIANVGIPVTLTIALRVLLARAAARDTRSLGARPPVAWFSRWYSCLAAAVLVATVVNPAWGHLLRTTLVQAFWFPTGSMETTILRGEHLLVAKWAYGWRLPLLQGAIFGARPPGRGELVVFPFPEDRSRHFLKRVIGLPGEVVEIRGKVVFIDGKPLNEPYARFLEPPAPGNDLRSADPRSHEGARDDAPLDVRDNWGPTKLPGEMYFLLGDNRDNSRDSRFWGFVREGDFLGRAQVVYWSWDADSARVRWERIGHRLE